MMKMMPMTNISASGAPSTTAPAPATAAAGGSSCSSSTAKLKGVMLHQHQQQDLQQHGAAAAAAALKCPRCDSSNTKFCYYNNYSLSQPRHFCKACKRYWTRGGTLRNVPVGGGCRKNKRVKKSSHQQQSSSTAAAAAASTGSAAVAARPLQQPPQSSSMVGNLATPATNDLSSFLYSDMNLAAFSTTSTAAYDALGLGGLIPSNQLSAAGLINNNLADLQQQAASFMNNDYSTSFGSQAASLLVWSLKQPKKAEEYQSLPPYDACANLGFLKDVKAEGDNNLMSKTEWQASYQFEANGANDASYLYWNSAMGGVGGWPDAANPSVAPLI